MIINGTDSNSRNCNCNNNNNNSSTPYALNNNFNNSVSTTSSCGCNNQETREEMASMIKAYDFALTELGLYLDTHPDDNRALCLFRKYANISKDLKDQYQKVYGPLTQNFPCNKWRWLEEPWPWERGNF